MPEIQAYRGIRYDLGHVGALSDVVAPPYDVISPELQEDLYKKHPCNVVRLILNRKEPGDDEANNRYTRAGRFLKNWLREGVLFTEADPAVYVYHQQYDVGGHTYTRRGFMARMRLEQLDAGSVFPHEQTMRAPRLDRLMLTAVCKANLSQIFTLYPDSAGEVQSVLENEIAEQTPLQADDHLGVVHRLWPVTDVEVIATVAGMMGPKPIFIADGHHRYETAWEYRDQIYQSGALRKDHPANFVLAMCVAMEDPGMIVLPTHRLFTGLPEITAGDLTGALGDCFTTQAGGNGPEAAPAVWEEIDTSADQATIGLYTGKDRCWTMVHLTDAGRQKLEQVAADHNPEWRELGVSILHRLIVQTLLDQPELPNPTYVHSAGEVAVHLESGQFPLAAVVMPATVDDIRTISLQGERMPAKSTYFYPKLLSGLLLNPLE